MTTQQIHVPLNKLIVSAQNVRKTQAAESINELAASIDMHGLLQPLVVRKAARGKYAVIAGQRRLEALQLLASEMRLMSNEAIPCTERSGEGDDRELSLAENTIRAPMHPADQYDAFRAIIDDGASIVDVSARFGISESTVEKRLKLGRLSPVILTAYRENRIDLDQAMAFTLSDDHATQERLFAGLEDGYLDPDDIRASLTQGEIPATDRRVRFIGLEAYEAAGGTIRRDLFDDQNSGYLQDATLLDSLVIGKLHDLAPQIREEGWLWVDVQPDADYRDLSSFRRMQPSQVELSPDQQEKLDALCAAYDALVDSEDADTGEGDARLDELQTQIDQLQDTGQFWPPETLAVAGTVITLGYNGLPEITRGLVRREDFSAAKAVDGKPKPVKPLISPVLLQELTAHRTAALAAVLATQPHVALAAIVHAFADDIFHSREHSCLAVMATEQHPASSMPKSETVPQAIASLETARTLWTDQLPGDDGSLWQWCLDADSDTLMKLLAFCVACTVDATIRKQDNGHSYRTDRANDLATALGLDMRAWYKADASYFNRISREQIAVAHQEAKGHPVAPAWLKLKKPEFAQRVAEALDGTGWLPQPLRPVVANDNPSAEASGDDDIVVLQAAE